MTIISKLVKFFQIAPLLRAFLNTVVPFILLKLLDMPKALEKYNEVKQLLNEQVTQVRQAKERIINMKDNVKSNIKSLRQTHSFDSQHEPPEETVKNSESVTSAVKHIVKSGASSIIPRERKNNILLRNEKSKSRSEQSEESE